MPTLKEVHVYALNNGTFYLVPVANWYRGGWIQTIPVIQVDFDIEDSENQKDLEQKLAVALEQAGKTSERLMGAQQLIPWNGEFSIVRENNLMYVTIEWGEEAIIYCLKQQLPEDSPDAPSWVDASCGEFSVEAPYEAIANQLVQDYNQAITITARAD